MYIHTYICIYCCLDMINNNNNDNDNNNMIIIRGSIVCRSVIYSRAALDGFAPHRVVYYA